MNWIKRFFSKKEKTQEKVRVRIKNGKFVEGQFVVIPKSFTPQETILMMTKIFEYKNNLDKRDQLFNRTFQLGISIKTVEVI